MEMEEGGVVDHNAPFSVEYHFLLYLVKKYVVEYPLHEYEDVVECPLHEYEYVVEYPLHEYEYVVNYEE